MAKPISLFVNEKAVSASQGASLADLIAPSMTGADLFIINGYPVPAATQVRQGDHCWILQRGHKPTLAEMRDFLYARHTPGVQERIQKSVVGIMGLGGLGSPVAIALARVGVGKLLLADFDVVDPTNLNRQQYFWEQIGQKKTEALRENISRINPYVEVELIEEKLAEQDIPRLFVGVDVLVECFDDPVMKAGALRVVLGQMQNIYYVGASGLAGYGPNNSIQTTRLSDKVYLVGDGVSAAGPGVGLMAPRVGIAAHHQANQVLRLLLGEE